MNFIQKIKLLFKVQKPAGQVVDALKEAKTGWKTVGFWITLLGSIGSTVAALTGVIPAPVQLVTTSVLTAVYNILRGAQKAETAEIKGTFRSTEFWLTALGELQKGIVAMQTGGLHPEWLASAATVVGMTLAAGQNLAAQNVNANAASSPGPK